MPTRRAALVAIACAAPFLTACTSNGDEPEPRPTTTTSSSTPTQTPTKPAWESRYTEKELRAYEAALARFTAYETRAEPIWARGELTPGAEALFKEYWITWPNQVNTLRVYEENGIAVTGLPDVIWSKPTRIKLGQAWANVAIQQCIDPVPIKETREGKPLDPSGQGPYIRTIAMDKLDKQKLFQISTVMDITSRKTVRPCAGD